MNDRRLRKLKRLAAGAALLGAAVTSAEEPKKQETIKVNSPYKRLEPAPDAGSPVVDAGTLSAAPPDIHVNSPPPRPPKATPLAVPRK